MRGLKLFATGVFVGVMIHGGVAQGDRRLLGLNHVAISVSDMDRAKAFYVQTLGLREAFLLPNAQGGDTTYLQISRDTFLELQPSTPQRPPGFTHFGLQVDNIEVAVQQFRAAGLTVQDPTFSERSRARLAQATDLNGVRIELLELPADSLHRRAMDTWK